MAEDTLNGKPLADLGAVLLAGAYSALMTPAPLKDFLENDDRSKDGTDVLVNNPRKAERDVTLTFLITGNNTTNYLAHYDAFIAELHKGQITLYIGDLNQTFRLLFSNATQFENWRLNACKIAVKFREPNPANRSNG